MKNLSFILNIVLIAAVAVLYYFHFKEHKGNSEILTTSGNNIVFINSETLTNNYKLYIQKRRELQEEQERIKETLQNESIALKRQAEDFQKKASIMSKIDRDAMEKKLGEKQQELYIKRDSLTALLEERKDKLNEQIYDHLTSYIKEYNKNKGHNYNFILGYQKGGGIIFANDSLDITNEILKGLNDEYDKENPLGK